MSHLKLGLSAATLELGAWAQLALAGRSDAELALYFLVHAGAAALLALFGYAFLPAELSKPRLPILALIFSLVFFVPAIGFVAVAVATLAVPRIPRFAPKPVFESVVLPELDPHERVRGGGFRQAGLRGFLNNPRAPVPLRLRALVTLQNVPIRLASPLLRDLLADPTEDLRLLAYGILDAQEKKLNAAIHDELQRLQGGEEERLVGSRRLAQLYWELVYRELVHGDLRRHALEESLRHLRVALAAQASDPALQLQLGRLLHETGELETARAAYGAALALGLPASRVVPYLAELAFETRDFPLVRRLMGQLQDWRNLPRLEPVAKFWTGKADTPDRPVINERMEAPR